MCHKTVTHNFGETFNQHCMTTPRELKNPLLARC